MFSPDSVAVAVETARDQALADRLQYRPLLEAAERYAQENEMIAAGDSAAWLLLADRTPASCLLGVTTYIFYTTEPKAMAHGLARTVYETPAPDHLARYTSSVQRARDAEYLIIVNGRVLAEVRSLPTHAETPTFDILVPSYRPALFAPGVVLPCVGPELQLIATYAALANPARAGDWPTLLAQEEELRKLFSVEAKGKIEAVGGADGTRLAGFLLERLFASASRERVLVGGLAHAALLGAKEMPNARVQILTARPLAREAHEITELCRANGFDVEAGRASSARVPTDSRARRLTFYLRRAGRREAACYLYNTPAHELVPFLAGADRPKWLPPAVLVGSLFVQARFLLVEFWTIQLLLRMGSVEADYAQQTMQRFRAEYFHLLEAVPPGPHWLPPADPEKYAGTYKDQVIETKRMAARRFCRPYYPAAQK